MKLGKIIALIIAGEVGKYKFPPTIKIPRLLPGHSPTTFEFADSYTGFQIFQEKSVNLAII